MSKNVPGGLQHLTWLPVQTAVDGGLSTLTSSFCVVAAKLPLAALKRRNIRVGKLKGAVIADA